MYLKRPTFTPSFIGDLLPVWKVHPIVDQVSQLRPLSTSYTLTNLNAIRAPWSPLDLPMCTFNPRDLRRSILPYTIDPQRFLKRFVVHGDPGSDPDQCYSHNPSLRKMFPSFAPMPMGPTCNSKWPKTQPLENSITTKLSSLLKRTIQPFQHLCSTIKLIGIT